MTRSVLDNLGAEVTGIVSPVSICMAFTVLLVRVLNPEGSDDPNAVRIANIYYQEKADDSSGHKIAGAIINAAIFVLFVGLMTFALVCLYKYGYTNFIWGYMGFAGFLIFFVLCGAILIQLIKLGHVRIDWFSFCYMLYNFSVVGVLTLFFMPSPLLLKQGYLVVTSVTTAFVFTHVPAWTTWALLVAMALYDLYAVLTPQGPLKMLLDVAQEREDTIPALIYEARAVRRPAPRRQQRNSGSQSGDEMQALAPGEAPTGTPRHLPTPAAPTAVVPVPLPAPVPLPLPAMAPGPHARPDTTGDAASEEAAGGAAASEGHPVSRESMDDDSGLADESAPLMPPGGGRSHAQLAGAEPASAPESGGQRAGERGRPREEDDDGPGLPDAIKLGLGDFIFYSVLVGRAAMYDLLTATAAYMAIIAGLGGTLLLLAIQRHALPALPFSIALGVLFYFAARWALEPYLLPLSTQLLYF